MLNLPANRNRNAWVWVAIAAISFASVARAEAGLQGARAYAHPVLEFLAKSQSQHAVAKSGVARFTQSGARRSFDSIFRDSGTGAWRAMLPVFFIGLISPLTLLSAASIQSLRRATAAPLLPSLFQRPPPSLA
jgi:hypothetical protein